MQVVSIILFIVFVALQLCDAFLTVRVLRKGGRELNPVMKFFMDKLGMVPGLLVPKALMSIGVWVYVLQAWMWMLIIVLLYAWVVNHNWNQLVKKNS